MRLCHSMIVALGLYPFWLAYPAPAADGEHWIPLFDGRSLSGWKASEHPSSFWVEDGMIVARGPRAHLFYVGEVEKAEFHNFELRARVRTEPGADSGIYFHTEHQEQGFPNRGHEVQIHNTDLRFGNAGERPKTGSLHRVRNLYKSLLRDNEWFTIHLVVTGRRIRISVDDTLLVDYVEPAQPGRSPQGADGRLSRGTFALQCHDGPGRVWFRSIDVRPLPDELSIAPPEPPVVDERSAQIAKLQREDFPLVDLHVHLKGGLTLEEALANSRRTGINYGIAPNCGVGFPITDDAGIREFLHRMKGQPVFLGMQAEGREWVGLFSREAIEEFDYVFTDAMTFTDDRGKRIRLWIRDEVQIDDPQAFMDMYVDRILSILNHEPIDVLANPTFLPASIAGRYDELWTEPRMRKVIAAAAENHVAIEINARNRIPNPKFIRLAKRAGVRFTFGTNNGDRNLGRLEYCLDMIQECGLTPEDMFLPDRREKTE